MVVQRSILMGFLDKMVAGSSYQAWNCCRRVLEFPLRAGHYLILKYTFVHVNKIRQHSVLLVFHQEYVFLIWLPCISLWWCSIFQFFELYTRLLSSTNYLTRRQAMKVWLFFICTIFYKLAHFRRKLIVICSASSFQNFCWRLLTLK
jgi:hypothetical protein